MPLDKVASQIINETSIEDLESFVDTLEPKTFSEFEDALKKNLESVVLSLEKEGEQFYCFKEEQLNSTVASMLRTYGYTVDTESSHRGKVDITVRKLGFEWLIEAKIGHNNNYIFEGFLQLTTRYLTNQESAGVLVYFQNDKPNTRFSNWCEYLNNNTWSKYAISKGIEAACIELFSDCKCDLIASPTKKRANTGVTLSSGSKSSVDFFGVNLYFNPLDKSGREGKAKRLFHAKRHLLESYCSYKQGEGYGTEEELFQALDVIFELDKDLKPLLKSETNKINAKTNNK